MDNLFERFLRKIGIQDVTLFDDCRFLSQKYNKQTDLLTIEIESGSYFTYTEGKMLLDAIDHAPFKIDVNFTYKKGYGETEIFQLLRDEFISKTGFSSTEMPRYECKKNVITFFFYGRLHKDSFEPVIETWEQLLIDLQIPWEIEIKNLHSSDEIKKRNDKYSSYLPQIKKMYEDSLKTQYVDSANSQRQRGNYVETLLKDVNDESGNVKVKGEIFFSDVRTMKNGRKLATFYIYDGTYSMEVIVFENNRNFKLDVLEELLDKKPPIEVRGFASRSNYSKELQIKADYIAVLDDYSVDEEIQDTAETKRVELHVHTKMSNMDAVSTITDYCKQAKKWGMKAIALTDHGVVQAFPEAQQAAKKTGIKMLYGSEIYMVDEKLDYIFNPSDIELNKATYVVFDFETTGLSARYDRIIEFGAVKFKDGMIVDSIDLFIDPDMDLPDVIVEKTHITNAMVRGKTKIKEALAIMKRFIGDSILVAHNASFDYGFLNEAFKNNGQPAMNNPVIDTLALAWYLFPNAKSHSLGGVCRQFDVKYDENAAHRANYDAEVLNNVWQAMLARLSINNQYIKHSDLASLTNELIVKNARVKHATVLAKNAQGLKDLFKIITDSHTEYFSSVPRVPRSLLEKYRENLLIGSSCFNGEVFDAAMTRSEEVVKQKMAFYDYIEVQPLSNYSFLVNDGQVRSMENIKNILCDLIKDAEDINKIIVATSDAHYVLPKQKEFRDVYVFAKAVGGVRHPLNPHRRDKMNYENPDQHMRSTSEMLNEFAFLGAEKAQKIVVENTNFIADSCDELFPIKDKLYPPYIENVDQRLIDRVYSKAYAMYGNPLPQLIKDRLEAELAGIIKYGYSVQFFIASEIVRQANKDGFVVGSRGSVGSSFVATMADITEVNALPPHYLCPNCKHIEFIDDGSVKSGYDLEDKNCPCCGEKMISDGQNLPFAVFLGFNAEKVPDIDLNFSGDYQARAHDLTKVLLGEKNVFRAGTIGTVAEKTAFGYVSGYFESLGIDPKSISTAERTRIAKGCQDVKRTTGQHPGGIIVIPQSHEVYDFTAVQYPADKMDASWKTTHFDFHAIHDNVLKLDLLGHVDPTAIKMLKDLTGIDPTTVPMNDKDVYSIFNSRDALKCDGNYLEESTGGLGIPEFGTALTRSMLEEIRPKNFADLVLISGLSHGTDVWAGNAQELLKNKVCGVEGIIACRDDIMTYLQSLGIPDSVAFKTMESVRKGKKIPADYLPILEEKNVPDYYIESANKCKYLFPKAHAIAYVTMAVRIAWFKVHKPLAYYATFFTTRSDQFDLKAMSGGKKAIIARIEEIRELKTKHLQSNKEDDIEKTLLIALEMAERGYRISNIDLYKSDYKSFVIDEDRKCVIPPFRCIDGLGEEPSESIINARKQRPFVSQEDLIARTKLNSQNIDNLRKLHVLDDLPEEDQVKLF